MYVCVCVRVGAESLREIGPVTPRVAKARRARAGEAQARSTAAIKQKAGELLPVSPQRRPLPSAATRGL